MVFSECLSTLGGDSLYEVDEETLSVHISRVPKCPPEVTSHSLPSPTAEWLEDNTTAANPSKGR